MEQKITSTDKAKKKLQHCCDYLLESGWKLLHTDSEKQHFVLRKERLVAETYVMAGLRAIDGFIYVAIAVNNIHSLEINIRNLKHFKSIISEWGSK
jgi:hypothetical protein